MNKYIEKDDKRLYYQIIAKNNKNTYVKFRQNYLEVVKSKHVNNEQVINILTTNFDKYYKKLLSQVKQVVTDDEIIVRGIRYKLNIIVSNKKFSYEMVDTVINVYTKYADIRKIKLNIFEQETLKMLRYLKTKVTNILLENNIKPRKIILGYYKTKFGSYHRNKDYIKLNVVLATLDINYLLYVILHEYAHTVVFNHSKAFYDVLFKLMNNYQYYDKNLKKVAILL